MCTYVCICIQFAHDGYHHRVTERWIMRRLQLHQVLPVQRVFNVIDVHIFLADEPMSKFKNDIQMIPEHGGIDGSPLQHKQETPAYLDFLKF